MNATYPPDNHVTQVQLLVSETGDQRALEELLAERYEVIIEETLQPADCYLVGDRTFPAYEEAFREQKMNAQPAFCPVLMVQRETSRIAVDQLSRDESGGPPLVDEVISAPVGRSTLYRRLDNLSIRRQQSLRLTQQYERIETRFEKLFESTNDAIFVIEPTEDTIVDCNPAACDLVGYSREELLDLAPSETLHSHGQETYRSFLQEVLKTGDSWTENLRCETKENDIQSLEVSAATIEREFRNQPLVILSARDVTERVEYREELELKTHAIETAPVGLIITDFHQEDNPIIYANDGFSDQTGYSEDEILGRNCRFLQGEGTRTEPVAEMRKAIDAEESVTVELRNYRKDGELFWNRVTIAPVENENGTVTHFVGFNQDVTQQKEYEQTLELFRQAVEQAGHGVVITDRGGTIEYVNSRYIRDTGYSRDELIGANPAIVKSGKHDDRFYEEMWETILSADVWKAELINQRKSGTLYTVEQTIAPITDESGEITHFVGIESDATSHRLREQQLDVLNRILRHNVRNTMTVISGRLSLLEETVTDEKLLSHIRSIETEATTLREFSKEVNSMRRVLDREIEPDTVRDIETMLLELTGDLRETYPEAEISVVTSGGIYVRSDDRLAEAIREAVENAVVHNDTDTPEIVITVESSEMTKSENMVNLVIADNGPGIPNEERAIIETGEETPLNHGTGVGLALINWILRSLGGEVQVSDNDPDGTRVTLCIPAADP